MRSRHLAALAVIAVVVLVATLRAQEPDPSIPQPRLLPPIAEESLRPLTGELSVTLNELAAANARLQVSAPYINIVGRNDARSGAWQISSMHIRGARVISRASDIVIPIDIFTKITDQPIDIARLRVESSAITRRRRDNSLHWRFNGIDIDLRDVAIGGTRTERVRLAHADMTGQIEGRPVTLRRLSARAQRTANRLTADADAQLRSSHVTVGVGAVRGGTRRIDVATRTTDYGDLHAFVDVLPLAGSGSADASLIYEADGKSLVVRHADARLSTSRITARGTLHTGARTAVEDMVVDIASLHADDLAAAYDVELPGGGELRGWARVDGPLDNGARVDATVHRLADGDSTRLRVDGLVRNGSAGTWLDLHVLAEPVRAADTLLVLDLRGSGTPDSLAVTGNVTLASRATANGNDGANTDADVLRDVRADVNAVVLDARNTRTARGRVDISATVLDRTTGLPTRISGVASGAIVLGDGGRVDADVRADSLPLRLIPAPDAVHDVSGVASGTMRITGTVDAPRLNGVVDVRGGGLRVRRYGTTLSDLHGTIDITDDVARTDGITADMGGGRVQLTGSARLRGDARVLDASIRLDRGRILDNDSLRATASADLRVSGELAAPRPHGTVVLHDGHFDEDMLKEPPPIDLDDPPYGSTAARVPWIRASRLLRADSAGRAGSATTPGDVAVTLLVERGFRIIDEDSDMFGDGEIVLRTDSAGLIAEGAYRIVGGAYNNFGERFRVKGGIFHFPGAGTQSRVSLRGELDDGAPIGMDLGSDRRAFDFFPRLESFAVGSLSGISEEVRRLSLLPETELQLARVLLYREPADVTTDARVRRFWTSDAGGSFAGPRARAQALPLLWAYAADEAYDWLPLERAYLRAGTVTVGPPFPGRTVIGGVIGGGVRTNGLEVEARQTLANGTLPALQLRLDTGAWRLTAFNEPRFRAWPAVGEDARGFMQLRRTGVRLKWQSEW